MLETKTLARDILVAGPTTRVLLPAGMSLHALGFRFYDVDWSDRGHDYVRVHVYGGERQPITVHRQMGVESV